MTKCKESHSAHDGKQSKVYYTKALGLHVPEVFYEANEGRNTDETKRQTNHANYHT